MCLRDVIEILILLSLVGTAFLIWRQGKHIAQQTNDLSRSIRGEAYRSLTDTVHAIENMFIQNPSLSQDMYGSRRGNSKKEIQTFWCSLMMLDYFDTLLVHKEKGLIPPERWGGWEAWIQRELIESPKLREVLKRHAEWYSTRLHELCQEGTAVKVKAYVLIQTAPGKTNDVLSTLRGVEGIISVDAITGPYDVVAITEMGDLAAVSNLLTKSIHTANGVTKTVTCLAM